MTMPPPEPPNPPSDDEDRPTPPEPPAAPTPPPPPPPPPAGGYGTEAPGAGSFGTQPPPPAGYGTEPPPGYGAQPPAGYGAPGQGYPMPTGPALTYADWPKRALSGLIDFFGPFIVAELIYIGNRGLGIVLYLLALAWALYNAYLGGQTGQSYGKKVAGTRLVSEATGQPIGGGLGIGRYFVHIVDGIPCYLGFLWPLWDAKRQTFADKLLKTAVIPV